MSKIRNLRFEPKASLSSVLVYSDTNIVNVDVSEDYNDEISILAPQLSVKQIIINTLDTVHPVAIHIVTNSSAEIIFNAEIHNECPRLTIRGGVLSNGLPTIPEQTKVAIDSTVPSEYRAYHNNIATGKWKTV